MHNVHNTIDMHDVNIGGKLKINNKGSRYALIDINIHSMFVLDDQNRQYLFIYWTL